MVQAEHQVGKHLGFLLRWMLLLWCIEAIDFFLAGRLDLLGIRPRSVTGLVGIPLAPFLHGSFGHLFSNTLTLVPLGWVMLMTGMRRFWTTSWIVTIAAGSAVWLVGQTHEVHIGASGLIFGYLGFLLVWGVLQRSLIWTAVAVVVGAYYGSMIGSGIGFGEAQVSWEGHVSGLVAGVLAAWVQRSRKWGT